MYTCTSVRLVSWSYEIYSCINICMVAKIFLDKLSLKL